MSQKKECISLVFYWFEWKILFAITFKPLVWFRWGFQQNVPLLWGLQTNRKLTRWTFLFPEVHTYYIRSTYTIKGDWTLLCGRRLSWMFGLFSIIVTIDCHPIWLFASQRCYLTLLFDYEGMEKSKILTKLATWTVSETRIQKYVQLKFKIKFQFDMKCVLFVKDSDSFCSATNNCKTKHCQNISKCIVIVYIESVNYKGGVIRFHSGLADEPTGTIVSL